VARKQKLTLVAAGKPQMRKSAKRDWSKDKASEFLAVLAETCNVSEACRRSRVPMTVAYRRRKIDAAFRAAWAQQIAIGYQRLEAVLLERAFHGTERVFTRKDGGEERVREYPNQIALRLLQMHRDTAIEAETEMAPDEIDEIRERLVKKLQRLKRRDEEQEARRAELRSDAPRDGDIEEGHGGGAAPGDRSPDVR
jgi:tyrosyl-tRNA synthetase